MDNPLVVLWTTPMQRYSFVKLISVTGHFPLALSERLVYSALVYASRRTKNTARTVKQLVGVTGLARSTVSKAVKRLTDVSLAYKSQTGFVAGIPGADQHPWFRWPKKFRNNPWYDRFGYVPFRRPSPTNPMTPGPLHLFALLLHRGKGREVFGVSVRELARLLPTDRGTIRANLTLLQDHGLIILSRGDKLNVTLRELPEHEAWWVKQFKPKAKRQKRTREQIQLQLLGQEPETILCTEMYEVSGYTVSEINKIQEEMVDRLGLNVIRQQYLKAERENSYAGSSFRLLWWKLTRIRKKRGGK